MPINQQVTQQQSSWWVVEYHLDISTNPLLPSVPTSTTSKIVQAPNKNAAIAEVKREIGSSAASAFSVDSVLGPYATRQEAEGKSPGSPSNVFNVPNPVSGILEIGAVLKAFFVQITRVDFWRSLGWIVSGVILMIIGVVLWLKHSGVLPDVVPIPI